MGSFPETYNAKIYRFKSLSGPVKTGFESLVLYVYQLWSPQNLFRPLVPQFGLKIRGTALPPGATLGSETVDPSTIFSTFDWD